MVCKESVVEEMSRVEFDEQLKNSQVILIDVAGTTTALSFIKETLFPYVCENVKTYLSENWDKEAVIELLKKLREESADLPKDGDKDVQLDKFVEYIVAKTKEDVSSTPIKTIQGLVYEHGYTKGQLKGHVFEDVALALESWSSSSGRYKRKVCVYSTGSIESQKLLFSWSSAGDLTSHINTHFDQTLVGSKTDATSYQKIATKLDCKPESIVFLTDSVEEAKAASEAGVNAVLVHREGNTPIQDEHKKLFPIVKSFKELPLNEVNEVQATAAAATDSDVSAKRKLAADADEEIQNETTEPPSKIAKTEETNDKVAAAAATSGEVVDDSKTKEQDKVESTTSAPAPASAPVVVNNETKTDDVEVKPEETTTTTTSEVEAMEGVEEEQTSSSTTPNASASASDKKQEEKNDEKKTNDEIIKEKNTTEEATSEVASSTTTDTTTVAAPATVETMEVDDEAAAATVTTEPSTEKTMNTNTKVSTTSEKKTTESKGTQVAIKVSNADVASQAEIDKEQVTTNQEKDVKVEEKVVSTVKEDEKGKEVTASSAAKVTTDATAMDTDSTDDAASTTAGSEVKVQEQEQEQEKEQVKSTESTSTSTTNDDEVKSCNQVVAPSTVTENKNETNNEAATTVTVKESVDESTIKKMKVDDETTVVDKPDTTNTEQVKAECVEMNGDGDDSNVEKKIEKLKEEKETKSDEKTTTTSNDKQETDNKTTEDTTTKTITNDNNDVNKTEAGIKDDNETETKINKKSEEDDTKPIQEDKDKDKDTKQTDEQVPDENKQVKENGSTNKDTDTKSESKSKECEKTEQKTENTTEVKSNGANGLEKNGNKEELLVDDANDTTKTNPKNGVTDLKTTNGDDTTVNTKNGDGTTTSTTNNDNTNEIKVKTVSDVVGAGATESPSTATPTPTPTPGVDGVTTAKE
ncbi:enolase-phosphatase E1 isoform X2 [Chrysoperla carnea]|uniref:enolase-phosphatase E1 isoform X2 n=1 Tax=Chrysoperla carnea TaxID=189513 RepID=UPI001D05FC94|nr:enolase-phosphatase E1 isoform X2 [Chrysoperla carnea]